MKRTTVFILAALLVVASIGTAAAQGWGQGLQAKNPDIEPGQFHEQMEEILEEGTYEDLEDFREATGMPVMFRIQSQEQFELMQEHHAQMEAFWEEQGTEPGPRGMGFSGRGHGGCPMMQ